jgi:hypothetical protein
MVPVVMQTVLMTQVKLSDGWEVFLLVAFLLKDFFGMTAM